MITDRLDPPGILKIPEIANASVATGSRIIHVSGLTAVDAEGKVVGTKHLEQGRKALENLLLALEAAGASLEDVAKITTHVVNYSWEALEGLWPQPRRARFSRRNCPNASQKARARIDRTSARVPEVQA